MTPAEYELIEEQKWEALVNRIAERLRLECQDAFGATWNYDIARRFARAALHEIERDYQIRAANG